MKKLFSLVICVSVLISCLSSGTLASADNDVVVKRVSCEDKRIALTFDDGPHYRYTEEILDILKEYGVRATFFVIGENAKMRSGIVEREIAEGHEVGNHTFDHVYLKGIDDTVIDEEITKTEQTLAEKCDYTPKLLRPPGGMFDEKLPEEACRLGYRIILWSVDTRDWEHPSPDKVASEVLDNVSGGDIVLMHDFIGGAASPTPEALKTILPELISRGYEFVTVSELIS